MGKNNTYPSLVILECLYVTRGDVPRAAKMLDCDKSSIYKRLSKSPFLKDCQYRISRNYKNVDLEEMRSNLFCVDYPSDLQKCRALQFEDKLSVQHEKFKAIC
jgi:hypothetical protein